MRLKLFTLGLVLCISALAAPNESARCGRHSCAGKPVTSTTVPVVPATSTAATPVTGEQSTLLLNHLLYI